MRIHSKYRDYYDITMSYGVDRTIHYDRTERLVYTNQLNHLLPTEFRGDEYDGRFVIGFCGQVYTGIRLHTDSMWSKLPSRVIYGDVYADKEIKQLLGDYKYYDRQYGVNYLKFLRQSLKYDDLFSELDSPIFVLSGDFKSDPNLSRDDLYNQYNRGAQIVVNSLLKPFEFFRLKDPVTAFQDISMYLGNQLVNTKKFPDIADKYKIENHGFDKRFSFRHPIKFK